MPDDNNKINYFTFTWKIENYHFNVNERNGSLKSPSFVAGTLNGTEWFFEISFYSRKGFPVEHCKCILHRTDMELENIRISFTIDIMGNEGKFFKSFQAENVNFSQGGCKKMEDSVELISVMNEMQNWKEKILIIQCFMVGTMMSTYSLNSTSECIVQTKIGVDKCYVKLHKNIDSLSAVETLLVCIPHEKINVIITEDVIKLCLRNNSTSLLVSCKISLLDVDGVEQDSRQSKYLFLTENENVWKFPSFLTKNKLLSEGSKYLKNGMFDLMLTFFSSTGKSLEVTKSYHYNVPPGIESQSSADSLTILKDFKRMYIEMIQTDVKLYAGSQTFCAHKSVLATRSPIFEAMFNNDMLENQSGVVNIPDVEANTLDSFLLFMYTGAVDHMDYEKAKKLLTVADKYQVSSLKEDCANFLKSVLSIANVCDVLEVADMINHERLKVFAVKYVIVHAVVIFPSEIWSHFIENHTKLATDILSKFSIESVRNKK